MLCFLGLDAAAFLGLEAPLVGLSGLTSLDAAATPPFLGLEGFAVLLATTSLRDLVSADPLSVLAGAVLSVLGFLAPLVGEPDAGAASDAERFPVSAVVSSPSAAGTTCPGVSSAPLLGVAVNKARSRRQPGAQVLKGFVN